MDSNNSMQMEIMEYVHDVLDVVTNESVQGIAVVVVREDSSIETWYQAGDSVQLLGAVTLLSKHLVDFVAEGGGDGDDGEEQEYVG